MNNLFFNNILNEEEIGQRKIKLKSLPKRLIVTLCDYCNLDCIMCEVKGTQWEIPQKTIDEIIDLFPHVESVLWQGGEIFLLNYFERIFDEASKFMDLKQTIVTNGILITEQWAKKLAKSNVELVFSIDGVDKSTYEHIRRGAKFEDVINGVKLINEAREKYNSGHMSLRLHAVIMKTNYKQLEGFIEFAKEYGFDAVHLIPICGNKNNSENIFHHQDIAAMDYIRSADKVIEEKAKKYKIHLLNSLPKNEEINGYPDTPLDDRSNLKTQEINGLFCRLPWQQLNIDPGGGVRPGCLCSKTVGNVMEGSLRDIWNSNAMQIYRKKIIDNGYIDWCIPECISGQISQELRQI